MARSSAIVTTTIYLLLYLQFLTLAHYTDDSDYNDFDYYKDLPEKPYPVDQQDDFYIASGPDDVENQNRHIDANSRELPAERINDVPEDNDAQEKWSPTERIYRYTKHRIPGYDYDELEFLESRKFHRCDDRSVWTHCLCQFTCAEPNIVDCYTPCTSGCECREDYVYDLRAKQCVLPEQCQPDNDYLLY